MPQQAVTTHSLALIVIKTLIKGFSILLMIGALGLEVWQFSSSVAHLLLPQWLNPVIVIAQVALLIHLLEASIAAMYAGRKLKEPISYGLYTFFVGTIALVELFTLPDVQGRSNQD